MAGEMTVAAALQEVKAIDDRIQRASDVPFFGISINGGRINGVEPKQFEIQMTAAAQSVWDLLANRRELKARISASNARTMVVVNGMTMSIANALEMRKSIELYRTFLGRLVQTHQIGVTTLQRHEERVRAEAMKVLESLTKSGAAVQPTFVDDQIKAQTAELVGVTNYAALVEKLEAIVSDFEGRLALAINTSNALTVLE